MKTLKDRLIELLSSPTETKFEKIEDYDNDNLPWLRPMKNRCLWKRCTPSITSVTLGQTKRFYTILKWQNP